MAAMNERPNHGQFTSTRHEPQLAAYRGAGGKRTVKWKGVGPRDWYGGIRSQEIPGTGLYIRFFVARNEDFHERYLDVVGWNPISSRGTRRKEKWATGFAGRGAA